MIKLFKLMCLGCFCFLNIQAQGAISEAARPLIESETFKLINKERALRLLKPLSWSSTPAHLARKHSLDMASGAVPFGHDGAYSRFQRIINTIPSATAFGENVAFNSGYANPAQTAVQGWLQSPGHYANIVGDYNLAGVGVAVSINGGYYFTQIFVKADPVTLNAFEDNDDLIVEEISVISEAPIVFY